ncbi:MAG: alpha/beta hydrolase [Planctomycetales bacterium]
MVNGLTPLSDSPAASHLSNPPTLPQPSKLDGCPIPLAWHQVLEEFQRQAEQVEIPHSTGVIRVRLWGSGPTLLMIPGMCGPLEHFSLLSYLLKDYFRCVMVEHPSVATQGRVCFRLSLAQLADRCLAAADQTGAKQFHLFATSFGGLAALRLLADHPQRVDHVVLQGAFARRELSVTERFLAGLAAWLPMHLGQFPLSKTVARKNHLRWFPPHDVNRWMFYEDLVGQTPLRDIAWRTRLIRDNDLRPDLSKITPPVLLIRGEGDGIVSGQCLDVLQAGLPNAQVEGMHTTGHIPHLTHPHRLAKSIRNFCIPEFVAESH